jgi:hypothetical protein
MGDRSRGLAIGKGQGDQIGRAECFAMPSRGRIRAKL